MKTLIPFIASNVLICVAVIPSIKTIEQGILFGTGMLVSIGLLFITSTETK